MRASLILLVFMLRVAGGVQAVYGDGLAWPALRGTPDGRAVCTWDPDSPEAQVRQWHFTSKEGRRFQVGLAVWASPALAVVDGRPMAFIGGYDQTLHALDLLARERRWFKITNGPIQNAPTVGQVSGRPAVFFGSSDRSVYAHDAADGSSLWTRELIVATSTMGQAAVSAPFLHDGTLYVTCFAYDRALSRNQQKGWLIALAANSGRELWRKEISQGFLSSPTGRVINGRLHLFVAARKGLLQAFDVSGRRPVPLWRYQMAHEVFGSPVIEEGTETPRLFLGSKFGRLVALNAATGELLWKQMAGNWIDNTACCGEVDGKRVVFVGSHDYHVYAFDVSDGRRLW